VGLNVNRFLAILHFVFFLIPSLQLATVISL
jgi:hypothetical protein